MTPADHQPGVPARTVDLDWPELITSPAFVGPENGHWVAVLTRFSVVGMGETEAAAWQQMNELAVDYLEQCEAEGMAFRDVVRKLPIGERAKLWGMAALGAVLRPLLRERSSSRAQEREFVYVHPHGAPIAC